MDDIAFKAMIVEETADKHFVRRIGERRVRDLPEGQVLIQVRYSSLNYKDALSASGNKGVTRKYPHTPGIDAAGVVVDSDEPACQPGDKVLVAGFDLGMNTSGGYAEYIRVPATWSGSVACESEPAAKHDLRHRRIYRRAFLLSAA